MAEKRSGFRAVGAPPDGERLVSMIEHQGTIFVATAQHVYRLVDGKFHPVMFVSQPEGIPVVTENNVR